MNDQRDALLEERQFLLQSLRDLDEEFARGDLAETDYHALRDDYTVRAADVLRQIDEPPADDPVPPASAPPPPARRWRTAAAVTAVAIAAGGVGYAVAASSGERTAVDEASGSLPETTTDRITRAQLLVSEGKVLEAVKAYDELLRDDPDNPVALAQRGWLISRVDPSLVDSGLGSIERAIAIDPAYAEARFFRGMILWRAKGQPAAAAQEFEQALAASPSPEVRGYLEQARQEALAAATSTTTPAAPAP